MKIEEENALKYFKENIGYRRLFKNLKEKYISYGEIKGNIIINKPSNEEKQALSGLMKKDYSRNLSITINLKKLQERLDESKFSGIQLQNLLNNYFDEDILTKKKELQNKNFELENFWKEILKKFENTYIYQFLAESFNNKDEFYQNIKRFYNMNRQILKCELIDACNGINYIQNIKEKIRIPIFATEISGNPHKFDKNTLCGKLFIQLLCYINNKKYPKNNEELAELYYENNLLVDDVSNMVLCKNIKAYRADGNKHLGLEGFSKYNEPIYLTLYNLAYIKQIEENKYKKALITENPAVFMEITRNIGTKDFPIICAYGQVKLAGIMLMDLLEEKDYQLYYSGDLDPEGIQIADKLKQRYKEKMTLIGFDKITYLRNISEVEISELRLSKLKNIKSKELAEICEELKIHKRASYEEKNIDNLCGFTYKL